MTGETASEDAKKVFISYKREEKALADQVRAKLSELGVDYFMDDGLKPDGHYSVKLDHQLLTAAAVLVLWTPMSAKSDFVYSEADKGKRRGVLVAALFDVSFDALPVPFNTFQASDLSRWRRKMPADDPGWQIVLGTLGDKLGRPGLASLALALSDADEGPKHAFIKVYVDDPMVGRLQQELAARREFEQNYQQLEGRVADWKKNIEKRLKAARRDFETRVGKLRRGADSFVQPNLDAALNHDVEALHERVQRFQAVAEEAVLKDKAALARVAQAESAAAAAAERASTLEKAMGEHEAQLRAARDEGEALNRRIEALRLASESTQARIATAEEAAAAAVERAMVLDKALGDLDAQFKAAVSEATVTKIAYEELKIQFDSVHSETELLGQKCRELETQQSEAVAKSEALGRELGESRKAYDQKNSEAGDLQRGKMELQSSVETVARRYRYARIAAACALVIGLGAGSLGLTLFAPVVAGDEVGQLTAKLEEGQKEVLAARNSDKAGRQQLAAAQTQITTTQASLKQEQDKGAALSSRLVQTQKDLEQSKTQLASAGNQVAQANALVRQESDKSKSLAAQLQTKETEVAGLAGKVSAAEQTDRTRQQDIKNLQDQVKKLQTATIPPKPAGAGTSQPASRFILNTNYDIVGNDLNSERDISRDACESKCDANKQCVAYTYDKWRKNCTLKHTIPSISLEPRGDTGVRADQRTPQRSSEQERFCPFNGRAFRDIPNKVHSNVTSRETCRQHCRSDQSCIAFTHMGALNTCRIFNITSEPVLESGSNSETKAQQPAGHCQ